MIPSPPSTASRDPQWLPMFTPDRRHYRWRPRKAASLALLLPLHLGLMALAIGGAISGFTAAVGAIGLIGLFLLASTYFYAQEPRNRRRLWRSLALTTLMCQIFSYAALWLFLFFTILSYREHPDMPHRFWWIHELSSGFVLMLNLIVIPAMGIHPWTRQDRWSSAHDYLAWSQAQSQRERFWHRKI